MSDSASVSLGKDTSIVDVSTTESNAVAIEPSDDAAADHGDAAAGDAATSEPSDDAAADHGDAATSEPSDVAAAELNSGATIKLDDAVAAKPNDAADVESTDAVTVEPKDTNDEIKPTALAANDGADVINDKVDDVEVESTGLSNVDDQLPLSDGANAKLVVVNVDDANFVPDELAATADLDGVMGANDVDRKVSSVEQMSIFYMYIYVCVCVCTFTGGILSISFTVNNYLSPIH